MFSAYKNFFIQHKGFPKFKSKRNNKQSCRFELGAISRRNNYTTYKLSLANIRNVKFKCNEKLEHKIWNCGYVEFKKIANSLT